MSRTKVFALFFLIFLFFALAGYYVTRSLKSVNRDVPTLFNFYYRHQGIQPFKAKEALDLILKQKPDNLVAIRATADWYLQQGDTSTALSYLKKSLNRFPNDAELNIKLAKLYLLLNRKEDAKPILDKVMGMTSSGEAQKAAQIFKQTFAVSKKQISVAETAYPSKLPSLPVQFQEDLSPLFNQAMGLIETNPEKAAYYLNLILERAPNSPSVFKTLGYLELKQNHLKNALSYFIRSYELRAQQDLALQIGFVYLKLKLKIQAKEYFEVALSGADPKIQKQAQKALDYLQSPGGVSYPSQASQPLSFKEQLLTKYYQAKKNNLQQAYVILQTLIKKYPNDVFLLKEAAYLNTSMNENQRAIFFWKKAYELEKNPEYALSIGHLYNNLERQPKAFQYFGLASKTADDATRFKAETALTNLAGLQTNYLPDPFFAEVYTSPFYFSRFDLTVYPMILRAGLMLNDDYQTALYFSHRRTTDNSSNAGTQNSISQIFEDNVAIYSAGIRTNIFKDSALQAFVEYGEAEDLIFRNRPKWREDLRGGLVYYNEWGARPGFTFNLDFPMKWKATLYSDIIYYSRYDDNIIGTLWFRPGVRAATFQSASIDVYLANYLVLDKNKDFFNNTYSVGPGIVIQPSNHWNIKLRLESLQNFYIPVNSPTPNPYTPTFYNNIALLEAFFRF